MNSREWSEDLVRVDLHLHSRASGSATLWWMRRLGVESGDVRESYTPPEESYRMVKNAGMDFVTLTDHETIEGARSLTPYADFFTGEEISARFPEDGNFVDVLVYGLDEYDHRELQARRHDIYELVHYLREAKLAHVLAHPMYAMPGPLDRAAVEKRLVLFGVWEFINGSRPAVQNHLSREIAERIGPAELRQMASRHCLSVPPHRRISGTGGSDDHGGLYGGATHTLLPRTSGVEELLEALAAGEARPAGEDGSVEKVVHTGFQIAAGAISENKEAGVSAALRALLPSRLGPISTGGGDARQQPLMKHVPALARLGRLEARAALAGVYERQVTAALGGTSTGFPALDFLSGIGGFIDGHISIAPYLGVHGYFGRETGKAVSLRRELISETSEEPRVGVFVDGLDGIHGVATMYENLQDLAPKGSDQLALVRCGDTGDGIGGGTRSVRALTSLPVPLYDGLELGVPSLFEVMELIATEEYRVLHVATPGPLGLAALISGLILGIPVVGAYHTEFGAYARALTNDPLVAEVVEVAVREFYERCSAVAVPSQATALALRNRGYRIENFEVLKNGVDGELFHPGRRDPALRERLGGGKHLLLYAGRVSREKDLDMLADGYLKLRDRRRDAHLVIAGDGPYRAQLEARLGDAATFTGFVRGEELARLFASCDIFVFPSTTDTLGRAVAEAQASGLPAIVCGAGGPRECIRPGESGFVAHAGDEEEFFERVELLLDDRELRERMGRAAREVAQDMSWESVMEGLVELHSRLAGIASEPARPYTTAQDAGVFAASSPTTASGGERSI